MRGTRLDPFGWTAERRAERLLICDDEAMLDAILAALKSDNHAAAVAFSSLPDRIRGCGPIKMKSIAASEAEREAVMERFRTAAAPMLNAAE